MDQHSLVTAEQLRKLAPANSLVTVENISIVLPYSYTIAEEQEDGRLFTHPLITASKRPLALVYDSSGQTWSREEFAFHTISPLKIRHRRVVRAPRGSQKKVSELVGNWTSGVLLPVGRNEILESLSDCLFDELSKGRVAEADLFILLLNKIPQGLGNAYRDVFVRHDSSETTARDNPFLSILNHL